MFDMRSVPTTTLRMEYTVLALDRVPCDAARVAVKRDAVSMPVRKYHKAG